MEIRNGRKVVVTGKTVCLIAGVLSAICGCYWLVRAFAYDDTNLPAMLSSVFIALLLILYAGKRS